MRSKVTYNSHYKQLPINSTHSGCYTRQLDSLYEITFRTLDYHARTVAIRFDLHFPLESFDDDGRVISRFFDSLKEKIKADQNRRSKRVRVHKTKLFYCWAYEIDKSHNGHYHVLVLINRDSYRIPKKLYPKCAFAELVIAAWQSALGLYRYSSAEGLVYFSQNHFLTNRDDSFSQRMDEYFKHVSYLAKVNTKKTSANRKTFGTSRLRA